MSEHHIPPETEVKPSRLADRLKAIHDKSALPDVAIITLDSGEKLHCKQIKNASAIPLLERHYKQVQTTVDAGGLAEWKQFLPLDSSVIRFCVYCEGLLVAPDAMTLVEAFELAATCGNLIINIGGALVQTGETENVKQAVEAVENSKEE